VTLDEFISEIENTEPPVPMDKLDQLDREIGAMLSLSASDRDGSVGPAVYGSVMLGSGRAATVPTVGVKMG